MQGIGWALYEKVDYDASGQLLTGSLLDYTLPSAQQSPLLIQTELLEIPSESGPYGVRGVGEPPVVPVPAAVANAIRSATGARVTQLPMTAERVREQLNPSL